MQIKGNGIAIGLGLLAVAIATTGTAYAVTASQVNITDGTNAARIAKVDAGGHLSVASDTSSLAYTALVSTPASGSYNYITSATTAQIAITQLELGNPNPTAGSSFNAHYTTRLAKTGVDGSGNCSSAVGVVFLGTWDLTTESHIVVPFSTPLVVGPVARAPYCLAIWGATINGGADSGSWFAYVNFNGYVAAGAYHGIGTQTAGSAPKSMLVPKKKH